MAESFPAGILQELVARGRLSAEPPPVRLADGNADRLPARRRSSWRATGPGRQPLKLTLGTGLAGAHQSQAEFAAAAPEVVAGPVFLEALDGVEVLAEPFLPGGSLESALAPGKAAGTDLRPAFHRVVLALRATERRSTESARREEWREFSNTVAGLALWSPPERQALAEAILPALYGHVSRAAPVTRWSNGDFTAENLLFDAQGGLHLCDFEHARRTHFFAEDAARILVLSAAARAQPALFASGLPAVGPAWHLYFWLRQIVLESAGNSPEYLARAWPRRLGVVRRLAEHLLRRELSEWSVPAFAIAHHLEQARWVQDGCAGALVSGWCHVPGVASRRIVAFQEESPLAESPELPRPDVAAHVGSDAAAAGYELRFSLADPDATLCLAACTDDGLLLPFARLDAADWPGRGPALCNYTAWARRYDPDPAPPGGTPADGPRFSILVPVFNPPLEFLRACLDSVLRQHHPHWELRIVDDASTAAGIRECLAEYARRDARIHLATRTANGGIARATNDALAAATGEFVVLLDHDDLLRPHALTEFARRLAAEPGLDALYSDEDKIAADGARLLPFLKPAFSPEFLLGVMYPGHALCVRAAVARAAGGFDPAFDGVQDYEFLLRVTERTRRIGHIPRILYHWRQSPASSALHGNIKGDMDARQAAAVRAHLQRRGDSRQAGPLGGHRVRLTAAASVPSWAAVRYDAAGDPIAALRGNLAGPAEVIVLVADAATPGEPELRELAALAGRPDSGIVAPILLSREDRILEAGRTTGPGGTVPLMRGFDPEGDGYNGTLRSHREVAAVSPLCCAIRRQELAEVLPAIGPGGGWDELGDRLRERGLFHRVCATARVPTEHSWQAAHSAGGRPGRPDPFFNPHFDATRGDYRLASPPPNLPAAGLLRWHFDELPAARVTDGGVEVRGWCFHVDRRPVTVHLQAGDVHWSAPCQLPRPDVAAAHPALTDGSCGFSLRIRLPAGKHPCRLEARWDDQRVELRSSTVQVPGAVALRNALGAEALRLLRFQMLAGPSHAPRPLPPERFSVRAAGQTRPRLTIVTPSFNQAAFLGETLRSVLGQQAAVDYVVQDGGSTDGSRALLERIAAETGLRPPTGAPRLIAWESSPDRGQADAIARGFAKTSGGPDDVMAWINSDDFYLPGALGFVADYFARHPEVDALYGHRILVDENSQEVGRWFLPQHDDAILRLNDFVPQETLFWRRRLWNKVGGLDPSLQFAMDWDLLLRFSAAGARIVRVPYFLACFRLHPAQKTSAAMHHTGQKEIDRLRARTHGREIPPTELESDPRLLRYLRRSAFIEWLWSLGIRSP